MTPHRAAPPRIAEWLVTLVGSREQAATIVGDLVEEFSGIAAQSGVASARRWYWRQSLRTIAHMLSGQLRRAPAETVALAFAGFFLYVFVARALAVSAEAVVLHSNVYSYLSAVPFWRAVDIVGRYILPLVLGWSIARVARGQEILSVLGVWITPTIWVFAVYGSDLLAMTGVARINVPSFSMTSLFCPPEWRAPHAASVANTLGLLRLTVTYWSIPTLVLLFAGAAIGRTNSPRQTVRHETAKEPE